MEQIIIHQKIMEIRGLKVILDSDLAALYCVETKYLKRTVKNNIKRFLPDFMFTLTKEEYEILRCNFSTSKSKAGGNRYLPSVFTESAAADPEGETSHGTRAAKEDRVLEFVYQQRITIRILILSFYQVIFPQCSFECKAKAFQ